MAEQRKILFLGDINSIHLQKWILALRNDFQLFVFSLDPIENKDIDLEGVVIYSNDNQTTSNKNKLSYLSSTRRFRKIHKEIQPDIVHAHYASSYGLMGVLLKPKNFFLSVWGSDVYEFPKRSLIHRIVFKWIVKKANKLFSTSYDMKKELENYTNKEICVIPFGIDVELFKAKKTEEFILEFTVGTVKALESIYGIDRLIEAFHLVQKEIPNSRLLIYGKGRKKEDLQKLVKRLSLSNKVDFKGFVPNNKVPNAIRKMDVFCVLSRQESFGVSAVEAAACERPVIASRIGGLPEVVLNNETGFLVDTIEQAAEKIILLAKDDVLRKQLGAKGRQMALDFYDWRQNVETMKSFYTL